MDTMEQAGSGCRPPGSAGATAAPVVAAASAVVGSGCAGDGSFLHAIIRIANSTLIPVMRRPRPFVFVMNCPPPVLTTFLGLITPNGYRAQRSQAQPDT